MGRHLLSTRRESLNSFGSHWNRALCDARNDDVNHTRMARDDLHVLTILFWDLDKNNTRKLGNVTLSESLKISIVLDNRGLVRRRYECML